jgi:hypothetical protein
MRRVREEHEEEERKEEEPTVSNTLRTTVPVSFCDFHVTKNKIVLYSPTGLLYVRRRGPSSGRHHCYYVCIISMIILHCDCTQFRSVVDMWKRVLCKVEVLMLATPS